MRTLLTLLLTCMSLTTAHAAPLVIALGKQQLHLIWREDSRATYDFTGSGNRTPTAWIVGEGNAYLVRDLDHNGKIEGPAEMFVSERNGFTTLRAREDSNGDGILDDRDTNWAEIQLWLDDNHNGVTEPDELWMLSTFSIVSIDLNAQRSNVPLGDGASISAASTVTMDDGNKLFIGNLVLPNTQAQASR